MTTAPTDPYAERMLALADDLRGRGVIHTPAVHAAFAAVRRDRCVRRFLLAGQDVTVAQDHTPPPEILDAVYSDISLMTRHRDGDVPSSSSAPSIVGRMLEALDLAPGMRVAEIGAGSGWNAALLHHVTGAPVVTMDVGPTAGEARESIRRLGLDQAVTVLERDGYTAAAELGPFDRIIVTCSIAGIPPGWLDQLTDAGRILAPVRHGGVHPIISVTTDRRCRAMLGADFMLAAGPLYPDDLPGGRPGEPVPAAPLSWTGAVTGELEHPEYNDLWFYLAAADPRITRTWMDSEEFSSGDGQLALLGDDGGAAWMQKTGRVVATRARLGHQLTSMVASWIDAGRPALNTWTGRLTEPQPGPTSLLMPGGWRRTSASR
jgi:protein-L-isoaspartate(D-aspartate) O-methyltransferase